MSGTRKLAAILFADVVGYTRLAGTDADRTLSRLRALCRMTAMARTPVLPEATPEGVLSDLLRRSAAPLSDDRLSIRSSVWSGANSGIPHAGFR
jgi:hypothetical protein